MQYICDSSLPTIGPWPSLLRPAMTTYTRVSIGTGLSDKEARLSVFEKIKDTRPRITTPMMYIFVKTVFVLLSFGGMVRNGEMEFRKNGCNKYNMIIIFSPLRIFLLDYFYFKNIVTF